MFQDLDTSLFRLVNLEWRHPVLDQVMPFFASNRFFFPALAVLAVALIWKGRLRGVICVLMLALVVSLGDGLVCNTIKHAVGRARPFWDLPEAIVLVGKTKSGSMPSSHAANWFAAAMIAFIYYRRSLWFTLPGALLVSYSRVYNGVHYPGDVLAGAILGAGYAAAAVWSLDAIWSWAGRRWFPLWWRRLPSLLNPPRALLPAEEEESMVPRKERGQAPPRHVSLDEHWLRLGYVFLGLVLMGRLFYIASDTIVLSEDEAYQWIWSKHLALSYFSKPPLIAYTQFLGTSLWGDTEFGVRFFSPVIACILGFLLLRFFARQVNARAGFFLLLIFSATPLLAAGSVLMTVDPLSVLFWTAAMLAGWRAIQERSSTGDWLWVGVWMGLGLLSKYTALFQLLCWAVFFALWAPARRQLRRPGPWLALLVLACSSAPILVWNAQHQWITVAHVSESAGAGKSWVPTLRFVGDFLGLELLLLNPVFLVAAVWACVAFWRRGRHDPRLVYCFSMGAPLFLVYFLHSFRSRVLPNWIAPSVVPLFCVMIIFWEARWRAGLARIKGWLAAGIVGGLVAVILTHDTDLITRFTGYRLPVNFDPLQRARNWDKVALEAGRIRDELAAEGKPTFIIAAHYGLASCITFYLPEAKQAVQAQPLVYTVKTPTPRNQFYFWPGYEDRTGQNAVYLLELDRDRPNPKPIPQVLERDFESVTDMGLRKVLYHGRVHRVLQVWFCRDLKAKPAE